MIVSYCVCHVCGRRGLLVDKLAELTCPSTGVALAVCWACESVELRRNPREHAVPDPKVKDGPAFEGRPGPLLPGEPVRRKPETWGETFKPFKPL